MGVGAVFLGSEKPSLLTATEVPSSVPGSYDDSTRDGLSVSGYASMRRKESKRPYPRRKHHRQRRVRGTPCGQQTEVISEGLC